MTYSLCGLSGASVRTALLVAIFFLAACGGGGGGSGGGSPDPGSDYDLTDVVTNMSGIMSSHYAALGLSVSSMKTAIDDYCSALGAADEQTKRQTAQTEFTAAMSQLQRSLMHSVGPALVQERMVQLYSWPLASSCQIDVKLSDNNTALNNAANKRGLDALEYLLFTPPDGDHSCPSNVVAAQPELTTFNAMSATDKQALRCAFMQPVAADAASSATLLADAWDVNQGNYATTLTGSGNLVATLNSITDAMFYFEKVVKENKLDAPLGGGVTNTIPSCGAGAPCPEDVESPNARLSKENLLANMLSFQNLYHGGNPNGSDKGLDDWLIARDAATLAIDFGDKVQSVIDGLHALNGSLYDEIDNNITVVNALLLGPVQDVSQALRFDVIPALGINLPPGSESDTD